MPDPVPHNMIHASLACNLDHQVLAAALPLLESGKVDALEWSFDTLYKKRDIPAWFVDLLLFYGYRDRLIGHGVYYSLFSGRWSVDQQLWLEDLSRKTKHFRFDHVTEHFGFMTGADFHVGAPMSIPFNKTTLDIGRDRLKRMYAACECPVGIENLAFSYSPDEVKHHGEFLAALVEPVNGFIILDLHNVYCQLKNFSISADDLLKLYPLNRVREIHISGGSWESSGLEPVRNIRRDTHDDAVPEEVYDLLKTALPLCPSLKFVVLEQLGNGLVSAESQHLFHQDFYRMEEIVKAVPSNENSQQTFLPEQQPTLETPLQDEGLYKQQMELTHILEQSTDVDDATKRIQSSSLAKSDWQIEQWDPYMLETAMRISQKWRKGF